MYQENYQSIYSLICKFLDLIRMGLFYVKYDLKIKTDIKLLFISWLFISKKNAERWLIDKIQMPKEVKNSL
jgi:hypothetical protein